MDGRNEREAARAQAIRAERQRWNRLPAEERERWNRQHTEWAQSRSGRGLEQACERLSDAATRAALDAYALTQLIARKDNAPLRTEWFEAGRRLLTGMALCDGAIEALRRLSVLYDPAAQATAALPPRQADVRQSQDADCDDGDDEGERDGRDMEGWVYDADA